MHKLTHPSRALFLLAGGLLVWQAASAAIEVSDFNATESDKLAGISSLGSGTKLSESDINIGQLNELIETVEQQKEQLRELEHKLEKQRGDDSSAEDIADLTYEVKQQGYTLNELQRSLKELSRKVEDLERR